MGVCLSAPRRVFSAKGASSIKAWGIAPGKLESHGNKALKAPLNDLVIRAFSAGPFSASLTWGAAPGSL
jgi:hypothetical protein